MKSITLMSAFFLSLAPGYAFAADGSSGAAADRSIDQVSVEVHGDGHHHGPPPHERGPPPMMHDDDGMAQQGQHRGPPPGMEMREPPPMRGSVDNPASVSK